MNKPAYDTLIIGAGAAGLFCAAHAPGHVLVIDHAKAPGEKIRISGGGRCNFTNLAITPQDAPRHFLSQNPHFAKSALSRFTPHDFLALIERHNITWHEKTLGQLFCDGKATQIVEMLRREARHCELRLLCTLDHLSAAPEGGFHAQLTHEGKPRNITARNVVVASGGKSIPKMGASGLAYTIARQFNHDITPTRPALVPLTFPPESFTGLSGISLPVIASTPNSRETFPEALLFTHRGLSGPAILQISSYWREGAQILLNLAPNTNLLTHLQNARKHAGRKHLTTHLDQILPSRLVEHLAKHLNWPRCPLADLSDKRLREICTPLHALPLTPTGSEGYRTAEVTLGGINTNELSSRNMMSRKIDGLFFVGECVDVTGWLGGYNFQWAWASGWAAAQELQARQTG